MYREAVYARRGRRGRGRTGSGDGAGGRCRRRARRGSSWIRASASPSGPSTATPLLAGLPRLAALGRPLLVGPSRKSFLTEALGPVPPADRDWAHGRGRDGRGAARRAHRAGARGARHGAGRARGRRHRALRRRRVSSPAATATRHGASERRDRHDRRGQPGSPLRSVRRFAWTDSLDIVIAAVAIYELLKLMRGTRAVQMGARCGPARRRVLPVAVVRTSTRSTG